MKKKKQRGSEDTPFRAARRMMNLTQEQLAAELDVARTSIIAAEKGTQKQWLLMACLGLISMRITGAGSKAFTGAELKAKRLRLGFTPELLGERLGFAGSTISSWERATPPVWVEYAMVGLGSIELM